MSNEWCTLTIGEICEIFDGPHATPKKTKSGPIFLGVHNLGEGRLNLSETSHVTEQDYVIWTRRVAPRENDIVFSYETGIGQAAIVPEGIRCCLGRRLGLLRPNTDLVLPQFLIHAYLGPHFQEVIRANTIHGSTVDRIPLTRLGRFPILLPPLAEQRAIAAILSTWDEAITLTTHLIEALQRRKQALMQLLLTGAVRFPGFIEREEYQVTDFGQIPIDWKYIHIGEVASNLTELNGETEDLPVLSCTKYDGLVDSLGYFGRQVFSEDISGYKIVRRGQFAYATNHIEEGSIGYQDLYDEALISPMYTVFEATEQVDDRFLYRVLKTEIYRKLFEVNTSASVNRRGSLRWRQFSQIKIPLPTLQEQSHIAEVLEAVDSMSSMYQGLRDRLQTQKRGLMQQLLTGAVRVGDVEAGG